MKETSEEPADYRITPGNISVCSFKIDSLCFFQDALMQSAMLLAGGSKMEGNTWTGGLQLLQSNNTSDDGNMVWTAGEKAIMNSGVTSVKWVPGVRETGPLILAAEDSGRVGLYNLHVYEEYDDQLAEAVAVNIFFEHDNAVVGMDVLLNQSRAERFITASWDASLKLWDFNSEQSESLQSFIGHAGMVNAVKWRADDDNIIASSSQDCGLYLWDVRAGVIASRGRLASPSFCLSWNPSQTTDIVSGCEDGRLVHFDIRKIDEAVTNEEVHHGCVYSVEYSPCGKYLASGSDDCSVCIDVLSTSTVVEKGLLKRCLEPTVHTDYVRALCWQESSSSKAVLLSGGWDETIKCLSIKETAGAQQNT